MLARRFPIDIGGDDRVRYKVGRCRRFWFLRTLDYAVYEPDRQPRALYLAPCLRREKKGEPEDRDCPI